MNIEKNLTQLKAPQNHCVWKYRTVFDRMHDIVQKNKKEKKYEMQCYFV